MEEIDMSCPYYTFRSNDYYCTKNEDYVNSDVYYKYCRKYDYDDCPIYKGDSSSGGCYLTSACVEARGLPDDCMELQTLRDFRDNWLKQQPCGQDEVAEYYATAPRIVDKINKGLHFLSLVQTMSRMCFKPRESKLFINTKRFPNNSRMET